MDLFTYLMAKNDHNSSVNKDLFSYLLGKGQSGTYQTFTGTSISANNTKKGKMKLSLYGNTNQTGTPTPTSPIPINVVSGDNEINVVGKNLAPINEAIVTGTTTSTGTIGNINGTIVVKDIPIKASQKYYITLDKPSQLTNTIVFFYNGKLTSTSHNGTYNEKVAHSLGTQQAISVDGNTNTNYEYMAVSLGNNTTYSASSSVTINVSNIMVREDGTNSTYEPYNKDTYELDLGDIKMRGIGTYEDYFTKNSGKNSFTNGIYNQLDVSGNAQLQSNGYYEVKFPSNKTIMEGEFEANTQYTISCMAYGSASGNSGVIGFNYTDNTSETKGINQTTPYNYSITSSAGKTIKNIKITYGSQNTTYIKNIQLEKGSVATAYEPYGTGQWCKYNAIGNVVLDGSENWTDWTITGEHPENITGYLLDNYVNYDNSLGTDIRAICNYFKVYSNGWVYAQSLGLRQMGDSLKRFYVAIDKNIASTLENYKTWLSTHNTQVDYVLATPYLSLIEDETLISQLDKIEKAMSYQGQTNISQINNDLPFNIEANIKVGN